MSRLRGRSQNRESPETCPASAGAAFQREHSGAPMSRPRLMGLLLALVTLLVYLPVCRFSFLVYDDDDYVTENQVVQNGLTWAGVKWAFTTWHASNWHPLTWLSHMTDCGLFGLDAGAHHYVNVLFHAANTVLLFVLAMRLLGSLWPAAFVAALFAWHPLRIESVAWVSERKDVLSTFFALLTLLAYVRYVQSRVESRGSRARNAGLALHFRPSTLDYVLALFFFALGLMAKPMLVTLPFVMLLLDYWPLQRMSRVEGRGPNWLGAEDRGLRETAASALDSRHSTLGQLILEKWPFFLLSAASCVVTFLAQRHGDAVVSLAKVPLHYRLENAPVAAARYLLKMFWPADLAVIYPMPDKIPLSEFAAALAVLILISAVAWLGRRRNPYLLVGWLWFLGTLVPVIGLVQVGGAALADRYTYIPSIGLFIAAASGLRVLAGRFQFLKVPIVVVAGLMLAGCLILTESQLRYWRDSRTLFAHAVAVTKDNDVAHTNLGVALQQEGKLDEALVEFREAERLAPGLYQNRNNLGNLLADMGKTDEALKEYREAVRLNPNLPALHGGLGSVLIKLGRFSEAMNEFTNEAQLDSHYPWPHFGIAQALLAQGRDAEAIDRLHEALRIAPDNFQILAYTAHVLAADENPRIRDGKAALVLAVEANVLTDGAQPLVLDALGMACAETGDFTNAVDATQKAIVLATAARMKDVEAMRRRLQLYQNHQPWRESFRYTNAPAKN